MRLALLQNKWLLLTVFLAGVIVSQLATPVYRQLVMWLTYQPYTRLVFKCDNAMRDHMIAKQRVARAPSPEHVSMLEATEVALIDCQDYDQMRKRLIQWGLRENELALMGLQAIEEKSSSLHRVIELHEIRY